MTQAYRDLAKRHPSFRERSETTGLIVEISLQPWRSFQPDGVILFRHVPAMRGRSQSWLLRLATLQCADICDCLSLVENGLVCLLHSDILTPLPALGVPFEIDDTKGPIIETPITSMDAVRDLHALDLSRLTFVGDALAALRQEVGDKARRRCQPPPGSCAAL